MPNKSKFGAVLFYVVFWNGFTKFTTRFSKTFSRFQKHMVQINLPSFVPFFDDLWFARRKKSLVGRHLAVVKVFDVFADRDPVLKFRTLSQFPIGKIQLVATMFLPIPNRPCFEDHSAKGFYRITPVRDSFIVFGLIGFGKDRVFCDQNPGKSFPLEEEEVVLIFG